jgi:hypothetical protein
VQLTSQADRIPLPNWAAIDHKLLTMELSQLALESRKRLQNLDREIEFKNRRNLNAGAAVYQRLERRLEIARERPKLMYEVCFKVLDIQGYSKTPEFVKMAFATVIRPFFSGFRSATLHQFRNLRLRTGGLGGASERQLTAFSQEMNRIESMSERRFEIEARELSHLAVCSATSRLRPAEPSPMKVRLADWQALEITFLSDERVQITYATGRETKNYQELGFADRRNEVPRKAWEVLRQLAVTGGILGNAENIRQSSSWPKIEKRIIEIRKILRQQFDAPGDPIPFKHGVGYRAQFRIRCARGFKY